MQHNNSNECAIIVDTENQHIIQESLGTISRVHIRLPAPYMIEDNFGRFIVVHNHPEESTFSIKDLMNFVQCDYYGVAAVVYNTGTVHYLIKTAGFYDIVDRQYLIRSTTTLQDALYILRENNIYYR